MASMKTSFTAVMGFMDIGDDMMSFVSICGDCHGKLEPYNYGHGLICPACSSDEVLHTSYGNIPANWEQERG